MKTKLLFICLGNICRSPAAQGIMQHVVDEAGCSEHYAIDSAGIGPWHVGEFPDPRMRKHGARHGYAFNHRARQFNASIDFQKFDFILVMDEDNYKAITRQSSSVEDRKKIKRLSGYMNRHPHQSTIPDPYYHGEEAFELAIELIEDACQGLFDVLERNRPASSNIRK